MVAKSDEDLPFCVTTIRLKVGFGFGSVIMGAIIIIMESSGFFQSPN